MKNNVFEVLEKLSLLIVYDHFAEGESPTPPFICFLHGQREEPELHGMERAALSVGLQQVLSEKSADCRKKIS